MKKIKVAFFAETLAEDCDGAVRTMYQIINRIPNAEFEFLFVCGVGPKKGLDHKVSILPSLTIPFNANYKMVLPFLANYRVTQTLSKFQPDIIHIATPSPMGHFALNYGKARGIPVISIYHTHFLSYIDYYLKNTPFLIEPTRRQIAKKSKYFYDNCDIVYTPTQEMIHYLSEYDHEVHHYKIWQRGINKQLFTPAKADKSILANIVKNDQPNVLFTSRLVWEKNLDTLIDIYDLNEAKGAPYNLIIAGDGVAKNELMERMPNAYFLGELSHERLAVIYASADVFLFTSITETYGNVVVEAMASGLPCVIANGGGSKSFIQSGVNGFLCKPTHARDYFNKIQIVLTQPNVYQKFVQNGLTFTKDLSWEKLVATYFEDLKTLAGRSVLKAA